MTVFGAPDNGETRWIRRGYRVVNGFVSPDPATSRDVYDPIQEGYVGGGTRRRRRLHWDLANLNPADPTAVERFASGWGLLGLFQHYGLQYEYETSLRTDLRTDQRVRERYARKLVVLQGAACEPLIRMESFSRPEGAAGFAAEPDAVIRHILERGHVLADSPFTINTEQTSIGNYLRDFIPSLNQPDFACLRGLAGEDPFLALVQSDRLWDCLSESIEWWEEVVAAFQRAFELAKRWSAKIATNEEVAELRHCLGWNLRGVHPVPAFFQVDGGCCAASTFPSLLSIAYMMLLWDISARRVIRECQSETCKRKFVAARSDNAHCSPECQEAQKKRNQRRRQRVGAELSKEGSE